MQRAVPEQVGVAAVVDQEHGHGDDDDDQVEHREERAVAHVRAVAVLPVDEARDRVRGTSRATGEIPMAFSIWILRRRPSIKACPARRAPDMP